MGTGHPRYEALLQEKYDLYLAKSSDYGEDYSECEKVGVPTLYGMFTRMSDKYLRTRNLLKKATLGEGPAVQGETLRDALIDLGGYADRMVLQLDDEREAARLVGGSAAIDEPFSVDDYVRLD